MVPDVYSPVNHFHSRSAFFLGIEAGGPAALWYARLSLDDVFDNDAIDQGLLI